MTAARGIFHRLVLLAAVAAIGLTLVLDATDALRRAELATVDARFDNRGERKAPRDVVFVAIDDRTFEHPRLQQFPFPRARHAEVIRNLLDAGARVVAYDVQFTERSDDVRGDNALFRAVQAGAGRVVLATTEVGENGETKIFGDPEALAASGGVPGNSNFAPDPGGVIRRLDNQLDGLQTFAMAAAETARNGRVATPPEDDGTAWIDFPGGPGTVSTIPFSQALDNRFDRDAVAGRIVVVGASAPSLQDRHQTSTTDDAPMPGAEIHAAAIDTVLREYPLRSGPSWLDALLTIALGLVAPLAALRLVAWKALLAALVALVVFLVAAQLAFNGGTIVAVAAPVLALALSTAAVVVLHGVTTAFEREAVRRDFARFVPGPVVDDVLAQTDGARLGGVRREATVLFSDLRGFTAYAEEREPDEVIELLNRYLTRMSDAILDHGGTLVAYMGDGIMAVFGAPIEDRRHADRALAAALEMLGRMEDFPGFAMGIGLNSGPVMSGNVGSERRLEYTAIGDTTNTAARIEALTADSPHRLLMSEATRHRLSEEPAGLTEVGEVEIRGRRAPVALWTVLLGKH